MNHKNGPSFGPGVDFGEKKVRFWGTGRGVDYRGLAKNLLSGIWKLTKLVKM